MSIKLMSIPLLAMAVIAGTALSVSPVGAEGYGQGKPGEYRSMMQGRQHQGPCPEPGLPAPNSESGAKQQRRRWRKWHGLHSVEQGGGVTVQG